jgi:hypothetical protein
MSNYTTLKWHAVIIFVHDDNFHQTHSFPTWKEVKRFARDFAETANVREILITQVRSKVPNPWYSPRAPEGRNSRGLARRRPGRRVRSSSGVVNAAP